MTDNDHSAPEPESAYLALADLPPEIQGHITQALKGARKQIVEAGESDPVVLIYGDETVVVDAIFRTSAEKDRFAFAVRELVKLHNAHTVVHINEMWTLPDAMPAERKRALMQQYGQISRMPERIEGLMVNIECRDGRGWLARSEIHRKGRAVTLGAPLIMSVDHLTAGGRFAGWFAPERQLDDELGPRP
jgi:hypothetical protein